MTEKEKADLKGKLIHKSAVNGFGVEVGIDLPVNAKVLHFAKQQGHYFIWYAFEASQSDYNRRIFRIFATGEEIPDDDKIAYNYVSTYVDNYNVLVWHLYERIF